MNVRGPPRYTIFPFISLADEYDQFEKFASVPPETLLNCGESSDAYAKRYGTTVQKLCNLNGITVKTTLRPGRKLRVK